MALQTKTLTYGDLSYKSYSNAYILELAVTEEATDSLANTSLLSYVLRLRSGSNNRFSLYHIGAEVTFDGVAVAVRDRYTTAQVSLGYNASVELMSGSAVVKHDSDGGKTLEIGYSIDMAEGSYVPGPLASSGTMTLTEIPRCSALSAPNGTLGESLTFAIDCASSDFTHTLICKAGSFSETVFSGKAGISEFSWTPPVSWAAANTAGTAVQVYAQLETFSGGVSLGTAGVYFSCAIPESVVPGCAISLSDGAGFADTYGWIRGKSRLGVAVSTQEAYGAAVTGITVSANGGVYSQSVFDAGVLKNAGDQWVTATVTDSRGRKASASVSIAVLDYVNPVISKLTALRCAADGSADDQGEYVLVTFSAAVSRLEGKNSASFQLRCRKTGEAGVTAISLPALEGKFSVTDGTHILEADSGSSYEITLAVTDAFGVSTQSVLAPTGFTLMHWMADGRGMGIGKVAEVSGTLDMGLPIRMNGGRIYDLPLPESDGEAASKAYADSLVIPVQNVPEFVNTLEECVDKTKLYVLPDGFLYGYILTVTEPYTNQIPGSVDETGAVVGLMANKRYNSSGLLKDSVDGHSATGYIPAAGGSVLRFAGFPFNTAMSFASSSYIWFYDAAFGKVNGFAAASASPGSAYAIQRDGDGNIVQLTVPEGVNIAYVTVCCPGMGAEAVITVDQEITDGEAVRQYGWASTGHAFVPADYEDRIMYLEAEVNDLALQVEAIEIPEDAGPPDYVVQEGDRVAKAVAAVQNGGTVTLLCFSDMHASAGDSTVETALRHAGQGAQRIRRQAVIDAALVLGDCIYGTTESLEAAAAGFLQLGDFLHDALVGLPAGWVPGNHDCIPQGISGALPVTRQFALLGRRSRGVAWSGEPVRGYGVLDLEDCRVRILCLNTADILGIQVDNGSMDSYSMNRVGPAQLRWLCEALESTPAGWTVIAAGHHPLDWASGSYTDSAGTAWEMNINNALAILQAYREGAAGQVSIDGETVSYDFAGKNGAVIAANLHGHVHNFAVGVLAGTDIPRIAIPNGLPSRDNSAYEGYQEEVTYPKTAGTAQDTAFCAVTVDPENRRIYAHHYGAGYDREISY